MMMMMLELVVVAVAWLLVSPKMQVNILPYDGDDVWWCVHVAS